MDDGPWRTPATAGATAIAAAAAAAAAIQPQRNFFDSGREVMPIEWLGPDSMKNY